MLIHQVCCDKLKKHSLMKGAETCIYRILKLDGDYTSVSLKILDMVSTIGCER